MVSRLRVKGNSGILAYFYAPSLQEWVDTLTFVMAHGREGDASSSEWIEALNRSEFSFGMDSGLYGPNFSHTFSVLSCPYGKSRLFFLFQGYSDEYTVCDWHKEIQSTLFRAFRAPMQLPAMLNFVKLWQSLEGKQLITPAYIDTYRKLTGVTIPSTELERRVESYILVKTLRFSPSTIDRQIQTRFQILEKFSWVVPSSFEEECRRGEALFTGKMLRRESPPSSKLKRLKRSRSFEK